jgi:hypothetical protein
MRWKHTAAGRIIWAILDFVIVYIFVSLAINSGSLWQWGVAILFTIDGVYELIRFVGKLIHGNNDKTTAA